MEANKNSFTRLSYMNQMISILEWYDYASYEDILLDQNIGKPTRPPNEFLTPMVSKNNYILIFKV